MTDDPELPATHLLITDLGGHSYRLTLGLGNRRRYLAITATGSQLDRWTAEIRAAIGAPPTPRRSRPYTDGWYVHEHGTERAW